MTYHDIRIMGFNMSLSQKKELYDRRFHSEGAIHLGFSIHGYEAFVMLNVNLQAVISSIYALDKELSLLSQRIPQEAMNQFTTSSMIEEIQQSNEVENVDSTKRDIKKAYIAARKDVQGKRFTGMVRKYMLLLAKTDIPLRVSQDVRNLYDEFILDEITREDPNDAPDGEVFRKEAVFVRNSHGEKIHEGIQPEAKIIEAMDIALTILNDSSIDVLIRVALFHYFFGYIHPFYNGNGRMTRFISSFMLSKQFSKEACLRISYVIKEHRPKYYEMFRNANDERNMGEVTQFVTDYLLLFREAIEDTNRILVEKSQKYDRYEKRLGQWFNEHSDQAAIAQKVCFEIMLQYELFGDADDSTMDINRVARLMDCSAKTARKRLQEAGNLVFFTLEGNKQIWHIDLKTLIPNEAEGT